MSRKTVNLQLMASAEGFPHRAIVIGCCLSQRRSSFKRKEKQRRKNNIVFSDISGSHGVEYEGHCFLGCCAVL
jgi:hypothetical protein